MVMLRLPPRIFVIFSGFQLIGWISAVLVEVFDPSSFSGTVMRVREVLPTWLVLLVLTPLTIGELAVGLFENKRGAVSISLLVIFWWGWLATLMIIVEPKNVAAFAVYIGIALFRAAAFASSNLSVRVVVPNVDSRGVS